MSFFSKRRHKRQAYDFGRQTAEVMLDSTAAVISEAGGVDRIKPGEICRRVLALRPEWKILPDGTVQFAGQPVSEWVGPRPGIFTTVRDDTSIGNLTPTIIACELTRLFALDEERNDFIRAAFDGCFSYFRSQGFVVRD